VTALWAKGFRPFFLLGALSAALLVPTWLLVGSGQMQLWGPLEGMIWHGHEMLHGFVVAVMAGFLLTAVSNWTQRETLTGRGLAALAALWLAGRLALLGLPGALASAIDLLFLPALAAALSRPLIASGDRRNAVFPLLLMALWVTNVLVHAGALLSRPALSLEANLAALHLVIVVLLLVTGRVLPMFTRNRTGAEIWSTPWLDKLAVGATAALVLPLPGALGATLAGVAALATLGRMAGWGTWHSRRDPLLWVLHLAHAWIVVGLGLEAAAGFGLFSRSLAVHGLTVGAIGLSTLGMMARVALGHTGRPLQVPAAGAFAFGLLLLAGGLRVVGPWLVPGSLPSWLWASAAAWCLAFGLYAAVYAPILLSPRPDGRAG
jgi:uncharacterized protein involved in response to NO